VATVSVPRLPRLKTAPPPAGPAMVSGSDALLPECAPVIRMGVVSR
jgi:hypothetical protein